MIETLKVEKLESYKNLQEVNEFRKEEKLEYEQKLNSENLKNKEKIEEMKSEQKIINSEVNEIIKDYGQKLSLLNQKFNELELKMSLTNDQELTQKEISNLKKKEMDAKRNNTENENEESTQKTENNIRKSPGDSYEGRIGSTQFQVTSDVIDTINTNTKLNFQQESQNYNNQHSNQKNFLPLENNEDEENQQSEEGKQTNSNKKEEISQNRGKDEHCKIHHNHIYEKYLHFDNLDKIDKKKQKKKKNNNNDKVVTDEGEIKEALRKFTTFKTKKDTYDKYNETGLNYICKQDYFIKLEMNVFVNAIAVFFKKICFIHF